MSDTITFHDCCRMILEDWDYRQDGTTEEWRDYFRQRLALLVQEFGIVWFDEGSPEMRTVPRAAFTMPRAIGSIQGPMFACIEYRYKPGESYVHHDHLDRIASVERQLKECWVAFFRDLLLLRWPEAADRTTSWSRLHELGLGEEPDTTIT